MSIEAMNWVWRFSPYKQERLTIHLAIGWVANRPNGWRIWLSQAELAEMTKVGRQAINRTLRDMGDRGLLEELDQRTGTTGRVKVLRMLFPEMPTRYAKAGPYVQDGPSQSGLTVAEDDSSPRGELSLSSRRIVALGTSRLLTEKNEPKENRSLSFPQDCKTCGQSGWVIGDDELARPCPECKRVAL